MIPTHNSIAYLLPIVRSGKVALISTANKALQEQLFYKDIPFVPAARAAIRGRAGQGHGQLPLPRPLDRGRVLPADRARPRLAPCIERMGNFDQWNGDLDLLAESLPSDMRGRVAADSDQCAWRELPLLRRLLRARDARTLTPARRSSSSITRCCCSTPRWRAFCCPSAT